MNAKSKVRSRRASRAGFTLMEVLLVLVILVILGSMAASMFSGTRERANIDAAKGQIGIFDKQVELYHFHVNQYPESLQDLIDRPSSLTKPEKWAGPYLDRKTVPLDPWDNEYQYASPGKQNPESYDVWSLGPDGADGGDDDIGNWE